MRKTTIAFPMVMGSRWTGRLRVVAMRVWLVCSAGASMRREMGGVGREGECLYYSYAWKWRKSMAHWRHAWLICTAKAWSAGRECAAQGCGLLLQASRLSHPTNISGWLVSGAHNCSKTLT
jgi:hypothetical protein